MKNEKGKRGEKKKKKKKKKLNIFKYQIISDPRAQKRCARDYLTLKMFAAELYCCSCLGSGPTQECTIAHICADMTTVTVVYNPMRFISPRSNCMHDICDEKKKGPY